LSPLLLALVAVACNQAKLSGESRPQPQTKEFRQATLPVATAAFMQSSNGEPQSEDFEQGEWGKLDLLVVIDDSGSMIEEQENLADKMQPLLSKVEKADWQIAVITTSESFSCQRALIKKSDTFASLSFSRAIKAGTDGDGEEKGILQAVRGLGGADCTRQSWVRPGSTLAVLIVSDEDNCQINEDAANPQYGCVGKPERYSSYLVDYLKTVRTVGQDARVYGLFWDPADATCGEAMGMGTEYLAAVQATQGTSGKICASDYTPTLTAISTDVAKILKYEFDLDFMPDDGTLKIKVDGQEWSKFVLEGQKVRFTEPPPFGAKVDVSYKHGAGQPVTSFKLEKTPLADSVKVSVNGTPVTSGYTWNAADNRLEFATPPPEKAAIKIDYKEAAGLASEFPLGLGVDPASIQVTVAGAAAPDFAYDPVTGVLHVSPPPPEAAVVKVSYYEVKK
jgi:hypothetical protein